MKSKSIAIIGLGKFGMALGRALIDLDNEVIGVDSDLSRVNLAKDVLSQVYQADAADLDALKQLRVSDADYVVVGVGSSLEASTLISLHLKELGTNSVWVKAVSEDHEKILYKIGVEYVIFPERTAAEQLAHRLSIPGFVDVLPYWKGLVIQELSVDKWDGMTLREIDMTNKYGVQVVGIGKKNQKQLTLLPRADTRLSKDDIILVIGVDESVYDIES